jgi:hypothetical protein
MRMRLCVWYTCGIYINAAPASTRGSLGGAVLATLPFLLSDCNRFYLRTQWKPPRERGASHRPCPANTYSSVGHPATARMSASSSIAS